MDFVDVEGIVVARHKFPPKEAGKKPRRVFQVLGNGGSGLLILRTVTDMSKDGFETGVGVRCKVRASIKDYMGSPSYTYWGEENEGEHVDGLGYLVNGLSLKEKVDAGKKNGSGIQSVNFDVQGDFPSKRSAVAGAL